MTFVGNGQIANARIIEVDVPKTAIVGIQNANYTGKPGEGEFIVRTSDVPGGTRYVTFTGLSTTRKKSNDPLLKFLAKPGSESKGMLLQDIARRYTQMPSPEASSRVPGFREETKRQYDETRAGNFNFGPRYSPEHRLEFFGITPEEVQIARQHLEEKYGMQVKELAKQKNKKIIGKNYEDQTLLRLASDKEFIPAEAPGTMSTIWSPNYINRAKGGGVGQFHHNRFYKYHDRRFRYATGVNDVKTDDANNIINNPRIDIPQTDVFKSVTSADTLDTIVKVSPDHVLNSMIESFQIIDPATNKQMTPEVLRGLTPYQLSGLFKTQIGHFEQLKHLLTPEQIAENQKLIEAGRKPRTMENAFVVGGAIFGPESLNQIMTSIEHDLKNAPTGSTPEELRDEQKRKNKLKKVVDLHPEFEAVIARGGQFKTEAEAFQTELALQRILDSGIEVKKRVYVGGAASNNFHTPEEFEDALKFTRGITQGKSENFERRVKHLTQVGDLVKFLTGDLYRPTPSLNPPSRVGNKQTEYDQGYGVKKITPEEILHKINWLKPESFIGTSIKPPRWKLANGGFAKFADGGIPAMISNGEYFFGPDTVKHYGKGFMDNLNAGKFAMGGKIVGPGGPKDDLIPMTLPEHSYIINAAATQKIGTPALDAINSKRFNQGGVLTLEDGGGTGTRRSLMSRLLNRNSNSAPVIQTSMSNMSAPLKEISVRVAEELQLEKTNIEKKLEAAKVDAEVAQQKMEIATTQLNNAKKQRIEQLRLYRDGQQFTEQEKAVTKQNLERARIEQKNAEQALVNQKELAAELEIQQRVVSEQAAIAMGNAGMPMGGIPGGKPAGGKGFLGKLFGKDKSGFGLMMGGQMIGSGMTMGAGTLAESAGGQTAMSGALGGAGQGLQFGAMASKIGRAHV